jgi:hypothetical protein
VASKCFEGKAGVWAVLCAAAILAGAGRDAAAAEEPRREAAPDEKETSLGSYLPAGFTDWLENAARSYQSEVVDKLSAPRAQAASGEATEANQTVDRGEVTAFAALRAAIGAALGYVWQILDSVKSVTGLSGSVEGTFAVASTDQAARDAKAYIEARRKAEEEWKKALERAKEAAEEAARNAARQQKRSSMVGASALTDQKRAEERKAYLEKLRQDLDRRIAEGLAKLEALEKENAARKAEEARALAAEAERNAAEALEAVEEQRRATEVSDEALKAAEAEEARKAEAARLEAERKAAEEEAARKAEEARQAAEDEAKRAAEERAAKEREEAEAAAASNAEHAAREARASSANDIARFRDAYERRLATAAPKPETPGPETPKPETPKSQGAAPAAAPPAAAPQAETSTLDLPDAPFSVPAADKPKDEPERASDTASEPPSAVAEATRQDDSVSAARTERRVSYVKKKKAKRLYKARAGKHDHARWADARSRRGPHEHGAKGRGHAKDRPLFRCRRHHD